MTPPVPASFSLPVLDPILFIGVDIGIKRDTCAIACIYLDPEDSLYKLWGHRIFLPPVRLVGEVEPCLLSILQNQRVGALLFDPYQFAGTREKLMVEGYGDLLVEVNQGTQMIEASNTLHAQCNNGTFIPYPDPDLRAHFSWANAEYGERGWRIVKRKQSKPIDVVVAIAMALMGATGEVGRQWHPTYSFKQHGRSALSLP